MKSDDSKINRVARIIIGVKDGKFAINRKTEKLDYKNHSLLITALNVALKRELEVFDNYLKKYKKFYEKVKSLLMNLGKSNMIMKYEIEEILQELEL